MSNPIVSIRAVSKFFGDFVAVDDVSIDIEEGEFFALLGPSGCGKTTLLRMIAGFETPSRGEVLIGGEDMTATPPNRRPVNMVFQSYAVFPHMTVAKNVAYGLKMEGVGASEIGPRVEEALRLVQLDQFAARKPDQLSGGQRQRVALARALVKKPRVLLLDEPLSALDAKLRDAMRLELVKLQQSIGVSFIMVTHDQDEAMAVADRIAVLDKGRIRQLDPPEALYQRPADAFVADFIGKANFFPCARVDRATGEVANDDLGVLKLDRLPGGSGEVDLVIRPENIRLAFGGGDSGGDGGNGSGDGGGNGLGGGDVALTAKLGDVAFQGENSVVELILPSGRSLLASAHGEAAAVVGGLDQGSDIRCGWRASDMLALLRG